MKGLESIGAAALVLVVAGPLAADDGPSLYSQLCASCHDAGTDRAPSREALQAMSPERILSALESGAMLSMAAGRTGVERRAIAEFVAGRPFSQPQSTTPSPEALCRSGSSALGNPLSGPRWNAWGATTSNTRYQDAAGFSAAEVPRLTLKWAFGLPGELSADGQPTISGGRVYFGTQSGGVYALSAATGCVHWFFQAAAAVRAAVVVGRVTTGAGARYAAFIGDRAANVYAVDAETGALLWKTRSSSI
jgi:polyvinyl alcohol dehydrogenase (cytochrome)